ncbi:hypothetical protein TRIATDRAFT_256948 [Trichoderma atroviride IMI 206040]|uniref:Uncharacterized protein n=1 Tax=Hypocrea atroviridis (strain ATCC 20476 / IMI 206040) TaxID=452589 RepID=G9NX88_HYPAI|nr:uncharacterized protein TRIATDRAFT_256948 [Trichoderma atroviride IMI 206040]EHK44699.1 hypothetical protein TRIATDRAFT_256948 [Trichoderma atroviride IMI 206040]
MTSHVMRFVIEILSLKTRDKALYLALLVELPMRFADVSNRQISAPLSDYSGYICQ